MADVLSFFREKFPWSKYKDLILDYYLRPYLAKVARLNRPILIVDCFAGPGRFDDGNPGSPLIILNRLTEAAARGADVKAMVIEQNEHLFARLVENTRDVTIPVLRRPGDFHKHIAEIEALAEDHTVFLYVDPIAPGDLKFNDLADVYEHLHRGHSVETLVNFLSPRFLRRAQGLRKRAAEYRELGEALGDTARPEEWGPLDVSHPEVLACDEIAGGTYWQDVAFDPDLTQQERVERVAKAYSEKLKRWFRLVLKYPIKEKYEHELPQYHLVFGSRIDDAIDLMNRAMVTARREFVGAQFVEGRLFPDEPVEELVNEDEIEAALLDSLEQLKTATWKRLRVEATLATPCRYTDSEWNRALKRAVTRGRIGASVDGSRIVDNARLWSIPPAG